ncbi:helix-turn-helix domain-containing protein [Actinokineospora sp. G85]|uniref:helix-turn-helix domain-containing protein n=1 Tax=Actinokineospora sp. G85 TaxID=3406626 RepID=UPI003C74A46F
MTDGETGVRAVSARAMLLAAELEAARRRKGLTTRELAQVMGMSASMVNRIMNGRRAPEPMEIGGLCALTSIEAKRRPHLYRLARESARTEWTIHQVGATRDPDGVIEALWALASDIQTFSPVTARPRWPGGSATWTHYVPAGVADQDAVERFAVPDHVHVVAEPPFRHGVQVLRFPHSAPVAVLELDYTTLVLEKANAQPYLRAFDDALSPSRRRPA